MHVICSNSSLLDNVLYVTGSEWLLAPTSLTACNVTLLCSPLGNRNVDKSKDVVIPLATIVVLLALENDINTSYSINQI